MPPFNLFTLFSSSLLFVSIVNCHPGEDHNAEMLARREFLDNHLPNLDHCAAKLEGLGVTQRSIQRRADAMLNMKRKREFLNQQLHQGLTGEYGSDKDVALLFQSNASCVLAPEEMVGPYYVAGESIRSNIVETQKGIPLHLDIQFIDAKSCTPVSGKYIDVWQTNATGVYGGVVSRDNGSGGKDPNNWKTTFLRGVQKTNDDGVVQFDSIFPGHYDGRTIHVHVMLHPNAEALPNGTVRDTTAAYVGQMYFEQKLIDSVRTRQPYKSNPNKLTPNSHDRILQQDLRQGGNPIMQHKMVGNKLEDGLIAWLSYGVNPEKRSKVNPIATRGV